MSGLLPGELAPEGSRSTTAAASSLATWIPSFIILMVFPAVEDAIGSFSYLPFVVFGAACGLFLFAFLPETKGKPVDEILEQWIDPLEGSGRNFDEIRPLLASTNDMKEYLNK